jgi:VanZ family protein
MRPLLRAMLWLCLLAITWLALTPQPDAPGLGWDKLNHAAAFLVLAALADLGWPGRATLPWRLGLLLGYGVLIELVQAVLAYRQGSALDFVADALGVAAYLAVQRGVAMLRRRA